MPEVLNIYKLPGRIIPSSAVYIGRGTKGENFWGNPFPIDSTLAREDAVRKYEEWIATRPDLIEKAKQELKGRDLVCYCAPLPCHGDILIRIANEP